MVLDDSNRSSTLTAKLHSVFWVLRGWEDIFLGFPGTKRIFFSFVGERWVPFIGIFFCKRVQWYDSNNLVVHTICLLISIVHIIKSPQLAWIKLIMRICFVFCKNMDVRPYFYCFWQWLLTVGIYANVLLGRGLIRWYTFQRFSYWILDKCSLFPGKWLFFQFSRENSRENDQFWIFPGKFPGKWPVFWIFHNSREIFLEIFKCCSLFNSVEKFLF